jgi:hypothetical protein
MHDFAVFVAQRLQAMIDSNVRSACVFVHRTDEACSSAFRCVRSQIDMLHLNAREP